jgi:uncharacterized SAM-binding protein YcdF (DUF218 family)
MLTPVTTTITPNEMRAPSRTITSPASRRAVWHRRARRSLAAALIISGLAGLAWAARAPLLRGASDLWIGSDPLKPADVAVVLGGGLDVRPFAAAELYHKGLVKKVLVSQVADGRAVAIGAERGHTEINRQILLKLGVPADAIETFGSPNKNTKEEALALLEWAQRHGSRVVIIPAEIFQARRVRWTFRHEFAGQPIGIEVPTFDPPQYTRANWWTTERGIVEFQNEILKFIYYRLKY